MPTQYGPQQFELSLGDTYPANNPADPNDDISVSVVVPVTLHWNLERTALDKEKDVQFSTPRWSGAGAGPHVVFEEKMGGRVEKVGTVEWKLASDVLRRVETNTPGKKYRLMITPVVRLMRTFTPSNGGSPRFEEVRINSSTVRGGWIPMPGSDG